MNKSELVQKVARRASMTESVANDAVSLTFEMIQSALSKGERVNLSGFGTFEVMERAPRNGRNPQTGTVIHIPACKTPKFRPGKALKERIA